MRESSYNLGLIFFFLVFYIFVRFLKNNDPVWMGSSTREIKN